MSGNNLSIDGELRYIIQWFNEWSELQREDFQPFVVEYLTKDRGSHYMNGVVNSLAAASFDDKPMSLFQCRVSFYHRLSNFITNKSSKFIICNQCVAAYHHGKYIIISAIITSDLVQLIHFPRLIFMISFR